MRVLLPLFASIVPFAAFGQLGADAARPGDENLTCDQLRAEMSGLGRQTNIREIGEQQTAAGLSQANSERLANEAANRDAQAATPRNEREGTERDATDTDANAPTETEPAAGDDRRGGGLLRRAAGLGGGGFGLGRGRATADAADSAAAETETDSAEDQAAAFERSLGAQPGMGRGFRLMELAQAKKCAFLDEGAPPRGGATR